MLKRMALKVMGLLIGCQCTICADERQTLSPARAADLDKELMSTGGFSLDQLMELAGLSVSETVYRVHPPEKGKNVLLACGPGNNGMFF